MRKCRSLNIYYVRNYYVFSKKAYISKYLINLIKSFFYSDFLKNYVFLKVIKHIKHG